MKSIREAVHDVIEQRILPWIHRDGVSKLLLPEQITPDDCARPIRCKQPCYQHSEHELGIGLTGRSPYCIDYKTFIFTPARIMLIPGRTSHGAAQATRWRADSLDFDRSPSILWLSTYPFGVRVMASGISDEADAEEVTRPYMLLDRHVGRLMDCLLEEVRSRPPRYEDVGRCILIEFMHRCLRATPVSAADALSVPTGRPARASSRKPSRSPRSSRAKSSGVKTNQMPSKGKNRRKPVSVQVKTTSQPLLRRVQVAQDFIHSNYHKPIDLYEIAAVTDVSVSHLSRQFRSATGVPPIEYLLNVRVEAAKQLLLTDLKVYDVAHLVGIEDASYFTRLFRRITGISPLQYRLKTAKTTRPKPEQKPHRAE